MKTAYLKNGTMLIIDEGDDAGYSMLDLADPDSFWDHAYGQPWGYPDEWKEIDHEEAEMLADEHGDRIEWGYPD